MTVASFTSWDFFPISRSPVSPFLLFIGGRDLNLQSHHRTSIPETRFFVGFGTAHEPRRTLALSPIYTARQMVPSPFIDEEESNSLPGWIYVQENLVLGREDQLPDPSPTLGRDPLGTPSSPSRDILLLIALLIFDTPFRRKIWTLRLGMEWTAHLGKSLGGRGDNWMSKVKNGFTNVWLLKREKETFVLTSKDPPPPPPHPPPPPRPPPPVFVSWSFSFFPCVFHGRLLPCQFSGPQYRESTTPLPP